MSEFDTMTQTVLEKIRINVNQVLDGKLLGVHTTFRESLFVDGIIVQINGYWWGKHIDKRTIEYPSNWKEAFKERWFPVWAKRRWLVRYTRHVWDVDIAYPNIKHEAMDDEPFLIISQIRQ